MEVLNGTGLVVPEPDWSQSFSDILEQARAAEYWRNITNELRDRQLLSKGMASGPERLVHLYITFDRAAKDVAEHGAVTRPKRNNSKAIARVSPHFTVMKEASSAAASLEAEMGLSPGKRSKVTALPEKKGPARARDEFLQRIK